MNLSKNGLLLFCFILCCTLITSYSIHRDILLDREGPLDLRNRIVGARLQKDGILPYFYKWKIGDPIRYYDPCGFGDGLQSNITATPFYHSLLYPIVELQQRDISYIWLVLEYLSLIIILLIGYRFAVNKPQKILAITFSVLFLLTEAWRIHIGCGQLYLTIPLLAMLFYYFIQNRKGIGAGAVAGIIATSLILIRPNSIVFFLPFLFLLSYFQPRFLIAFFLAGTLLLMFHFSDNQNRLYWQDYNKMIDISVIVHQTPGNKAPLPTVKLEDWEGWNTTQMEKDVAANQFSYHSEHGNIFVLYSHIFKGSIQVSLLHILSAVSLIILMGLYYFSSRRTHLFTFPNAAIIGSCLYMITDFFSPIWRHQYNTVVWIFPLLIAATVYKKANKWFYIPLGVGLILNIINTDLIKMEHTIGEYLFLLTFVCLALTRNLKTSE